MYTILESTNSRDKPGAQGQVTAKTAVWQASDIEHLVTWTPLIRTLIARHKGEFRGNPLALNPHSLHHSTKPHLDVRNTTPNMQRTELCVWGNRRKWFFFWQMCDILLEVTKFGDTSDIFPYLMTPTHWCLRHLIIPLLDNIRMPRGMWHNYVPASQNCFSVLLFNMTDYHTKNPHFPFKFNGVFFEWTICIQYRPIKNSNSTMQLKFILLITWVSYALLSLVILNIIRGELQTLS